MNLCHCGCGKEVTNENNKFLNGHNCRGLKRNPLSALKQKQTCFKKYGIENPNLLKEIKEKIKEKHIEKYGIPSSNQSEEVKKKKIQTNIKHRNVENPFQSEIIKNQIKQTHLEKLGVSNPSQSETIKIKKKQTNIEHRGVSVPYQSTEVKEKGKITCLNKYGNEYYSQSTEGRKLARINRVKTVEIQKLNGEPLMPCIGYLERPCLNELEIAINKKIIRNDHSVFDLVAFFPDGHIPELKLFIEFDEEHHFEDKKEMTILKQKDVERQLVLESIPGYRVFRISEKQWNENKYSIINQLKLLIENERKI